MHKIFARVWRHGIVFFDRQTQIPVKETVTACRHRYCVQKAYLNARTMKQKHRF